MNNRALPEDELKNRLATLPCRKMVAFAASCAERLIPAYARFSEKASMVSYPPSLYRHALDTIWRAILGAEIEKHLVEELEEICMDSIPTEDDAWRFGEPYAEDTAATVVFAVRAWLNCNHIEAFFAARRVYDVLDNFVVGSINSSRFDEKEISAHPLIQKELARQLYDLEMLELKTSPLIEQETIKAIRSRAEKDSLTIFG